MINEDTNYIYGRNAIIEALNSESELEKIFLLYGIQGGVVDKITYLARKNKIPLVVFDKRKFEQLEQNACGENIKSQGVIALKSIVKTIDIFELINIAYKKSEHPIIVALDEINDPHNLGAIARTAECVGAAGIIVPERNSAPISAVSIKSSAGALEYLPIAKVSNFNQAIEFCKEEGFWVVGTDLESTNNYTDGIYDRPILLIIGNEGKGMRPSTAKHCDIKVKIEMHGQIQSLNASVSAGVVLFEIMRQRSKINIS